MLLGVKYIRKNLTRPYTTSDVWKSHVDEYSIQDITERKKKGDYNANRDRPV